MKLELKHLAAYLPYKSIWSLPDEEDCTKHYLMELDKDNVDWFLTEGKPLLLPLSQLGEQYPKTVRGIRYVDEINKTCMYSLDKNGEFYDLPEAMGLQDVWETFDKLFEQHFDVFGLIDAGLALNKLDYEK